MLSDLLQFRSKKTNLRTSFYDSHTGMFFSLMLNTVSHKFYLSCVFTNLWNSMYAPFHMENVKKLARRYPKIEWSRKSLSRLLYFTFLFLFCIMRRNFLNNIWRCVIYWNSSQSQYILLKCVPTVLFAR